MISSENHTVYQAFATCTQFTFIVFGSNIDFCISFSENIRMSYKDIKEQIWLSFLKIKYSGAIKLV